MFDPKGNVVQDPKSGENVAKHQLPEGADEKLRGIFQSHSKISMEIAGRSEQVLLHQKANFDLIDKKISCEGAIKKELRRLCRKAQLNESEPWGYNMQERCLEKRLPPIVPVAPPGDKK